MHDRRSKERCPHCQGPTKYVEDSLVCRNSLCSFNHRFRECSRCGQKAAEALSYSQGEFELRCSDCLNKWKEKDSN